MGKDVASDLRIRGGARGKVGMASAALGLLATTFAFVAGPSSGAAASPAGTVSVTSCSNSGTGTLRQAVQSASSGSTISFHVPCSTITLAGDIAIDRSLHISGPGAAALAVSGGKKNAIFQVASGATVTISGLTLEEGVAAPSAAGALTNHGTTTLTNDDLTGNMGGGCTTFGGAILNEGTLTVNGSTISGNSVIRGGGIYNNAGATLHVNESTMANNDSGGAAPPQACFGEGGGIYNAGVATIETSTFSADSVGYKGDGAGVFNAGNATIANSTFSGNTAGADGGAIYQDGNQPGPRIVINLSFITLAYNNASIGGGLFVVSGNNSGGGVGMLIAQNKGGDCGITSIPAHQTPPPWSLADDPTCAKDFSFSSAAHDITGSAKLSVLANNGGPTETIALLGASPALGFVTDGSVCPARDQRGVDRLVPCDIGAWNGVPVTPPGYRLVGGDGGVFDFGSTPYKGGLHGQVLPAPIVGIDNTIDAQGYWMVGRSGKVYPFGDAGNYGELPSTPGSPVIGIAGTTDSKGYWVAEAGGAVVPFGDAKRFAPVSHPASPIAGIVADPQGVGYWLVTRAGKVYPFGSAASYGEVKGEPPVSGTVTGMSVIRSAKGYWLMNSTGSVFAFGAAKIFGFTGGNKPPAGSSFVGIASSPDGAGYWLVTATGYVESFGDARFLGDEHTAKLTKPIFGVSAYP